MQQAHVKVIDYSNKLKCYRCSGTGKELGKICPTCNGTKMWKEQRFCLIAQTPSGEHIAFEVDSPGK